MTIYRYDQTRHAMVAVSATNEWPYAKLPPSIAAAKPSLGRLLLNWANKEASEQTARRIYKALGLLVASYGLIIAFGMIFLLSGCASTQPTPPPTTTASPSGITLPTVRKRAPVPPAERVQRVFDGTASQATGMAGSNASRAVRVTGNAQIDTLLSGAVRNGVTELRGWWRDQP